VAFVYVEEGLRREVGVGGLVLGWCARGENAWLMRGS
jgi:hypothetical protein